MNNLLKQQSTLYDQAISKLDNLYSQLSTESEATMGYPVNKGFDYSTLFRFLKLPINNIGDPFQSGTYKVHTRDLETEVVDFFADLFRAPEDNYWGYVTNGGTEGNLYGIYLARSVYPKGVVYYSSAAHYSIEKNIKILGMESVKIGVNHKDEIDLNDLASKAVKDRPAIIVANIGSTMKEAKDDIIGIRRTLENIGMKEIYMHSDAALCGATLPFISNSCAFDFVDGCDSIAVSGHKFVGCPIPCGVVVCRKDLIDLESSYISYIDGYDNTITGSRNGITPLFLWYQLMSLGKSGLKERVELCIKNATYAESKMKALGHEVSRNRDSITLVFKRPIDAVVDRWQLACHDDIAHLICMPNISRAHIDAFISDLEKSC